MNKIIFLIYIFVFIGFSVFAETNYIIWTNDFSQSTDWVADYNDIYANGPWVVGNESPGGEDAVYMGTIRSLTYQNGYALFDSDGLGMGINNQNSWLTYKCSIDCSEQTNVILCFQSYYRKGEANCSLEISNDSVNWQEYFVHTTLALTDCSDNPDFVRVDISSIADNQPNVYVRFRYNGDQGYAWMIDDIVLMSKPDYDLELVDAHINFFDFPHFYDSNLLWEDYYSRYGHYSQIPMSQMNNENSNMVFDAVIANNGSEAITPYVHVQVIGPLGYAIYDDVFEYDTEIPPGEKDTLFVCSEPFRIDKPDLGVYYFTYELLPENYTDIYDADNHFLDSTEITLNRYARDNGNMTGTIKTTDINWPNYPHDRVALAYQLTSSTNIKAVEIFIPETATNFESIGGGFYLYYDYPYATSIVSVNPIHYSEVDTLGKWYRADIDLPNGYFQFNVYQHKIIIFSFYFIPEYFNFAVDHSVNTTGNDILGRGNIGDVFFYTHNYHAVPMLRLIVEDEFSSKEALLASSYKIRIIGNPVSQSLVMDIDPSLLGNLICIYNIVGQKIITQMVQSERMHIDVSTLESGVYFTGIENKGRLQRFVVH